MPTNAMFTLEPQKEKDQDTEYSIQIYIAFDNF